ncbi:unnamed protein product [Closterium sp. NIES-65]|nr:unnamed protein product [Closterium sp. NIES-65]
MTERTSDDGDDGEQRTHGLAIPHAADSGGRHSLFDLDRHEQPESRSEQRSNPRERGARGRRKPKRLRQLYQHRLAVRQSLQLHALREFFLPPFQRLWRLVRLG